MLVETATILQLLSAMFILALKIAAPMLLSAMAAGLLISLFQAVTQINDSTLSFLPKIVVVAVVLWLTIPWLLQETTSFLTQTCHMMEQVSR